MGSCNICCTQNEPVVHHQQVVNNCPLILPLLPTPEAVGQAIGVVSLSQLIWPFPYFLDFIMAEPSSLALLDICLKTTDSSQHRGGESWIWFSSGSCDGVMTIP